MAVNRSDLALAAADLRFQLSRPDIDRFALFNERAAELRAKAGDDDREWLEDWLCDTAYAAGLPSERAETARMLAAQGRASWDDDAPEPGPHPLFAAIPVESTKGLDIKHSLDLVRATGIGTTTWGVLASGQGIWVADARPGVTLADIADTLSMLQAYANLRSIRLRVPGMDVQPAEGIDFQKIEALREDYRM